MVGLPPIWPACAAGCCGRLLRRLRRPAVRIHGVAPSFVLSLRPRLLPLTLLKPLPLLRHELCLHPLSPPLLTGHCRLACLEVLRCDCWRRLQC